MKIAIIGGGPAGLYFARLRKRSHPADDVVVFEQNQPGVTYGFGVSIADSAASRYSSVDPVLVSRIAEASLPMPVQRITVGTERYDLDHRHHGSAIERKTLLDILTDACREVGVEIRHAQRVDAPHTLDAFDLIVGADGANSAVLATDAAAFGSQVGALQNRFAWYGVRRSLPRAGLSFRRHGDWHFVAHYYPYTPALSTFVAEADGPTWERGFGTLTDGERRKVFEQVFAEELHGETLVENRSVWRQFRHVDNRRWHVGRRVLLGDALSIAHFSIGSGTRLAMDDALALFDAFQTTGDDVEAALQVFEHARRPVRGKLMNAARHSWTWYEDFARHMELPLLEFVHSYMTRTGRMDEQRLAKTVPGFVADYAAWRRDHVEPTRVQP